MIDALAIKRRQFLMGSAGLAGVAAYGMPAFAQDGGKLPAYASWKDADDLIVINRE